MNFGIFIQLILVSMGATSAMTWFSYLMSENFKKLYKEPVLLGFALKKTKYNLSEKSQKTWGWLIHYIIGFLFVMGYYVVWVKDILPVSLLSALILGAISGVIGILSWIVIFKMTRHQPPIDFTGYYIQLFFAHIIFALTATLLYYITTTF